MKYKNFRKLNEHVGDAWEDGPEKDEMNRELEDLYQADREYDAADLDREMKMGSRGDEDDIPIEFGYGNTEEEDDDYYDMPTPRNKRGETDLDSIDLDELPVETEEVEYSDELEPSDNFEMSSGSDLESELRDLQAELRELPKGDPRKKELASQILAIHKQLSEEDDDYTSRHKSRLDKMGREEVKRQSWISSMLDNPEDANESSRVLRCSEWMLLEKKRTEVMKEANKKYPNLSKAEMQKMLKDQKAGAKDFKTKAKKYFGWAKDPEAAAAAFIRKATGKEPKDA